MRLNPKHWFKSDRVEKLNEELTNIKSQLTTFTNEFGINMIRQLHAGQNVTVESSLNFDVVYSCIRDKSESIGQLPVVIKRNGKVIEKGKREHRILARRPNDYQTMQDFIEFYITSLETRGNFYFIPIRNRLNSISELLPLRWQQNVKPNMDTNGRVYYTYVTNDGKPNIRFAGDELVHIKLNSVNGFEGMSPLTQNAKAIGIAIAQETHLSSLMSESAMPKGVLMTDAVFKDDNAVKRLRDQWQEMYGGVSKSGKTPLLENGTKYLPLGLSPADSELIKQRVFSRLQICSIFRVPPSRVGVVEAQKYKTLEENNKSYLKDSLVPLIVKLESAMDEIIPDDMEWKLDTRKYGRGDRQSEVESIGSEFKLGFISMNEGRVDLERDEVEGGDVHAIDTNNLTFGKLTDIPKLQQEQRALAMAGSKPPEQNDEDEENVE